MFRAGQMVSVGPSRYTVVSKLGEGTYGAVFKVVDMADRREKAMKTIKGENEGCEEARNLKALDGVEGVQKLHNSFMFNNHLVLVLEFYLCDLGKIAASQRCSQRLVSKIGFNALHILWQMHHIGILHRDIKPENLMLSYDGAKAEIRLIDFGCSVVYKTPEGQRQKVPRKDYGFKLSPYSSYNMSLEIPATVFDDCEMMLYCLMAIRKCYPFNVESLKDRNELKEKFHSHPQDYLGRKNRFLVPFAQLLFAQQARRAIDYPALIDCVKKSAKFNDKMPFIVHFGRRGRISIE
ncbi:hypothetical protein B9Z55_028791 [Caenorhabditis nigoni]|uniref:Protein kinase domain-containing protein n=2 Tax=Caenorhabditis nigoni TaxID=1611254 RepID=A0A2G5SAH0_9PELO|nr:hypothetical protein B9Z55_028791 [Caenorhabditis nigoni]